MKFSLSVRSEMAYDLLTKLLNNKAAVLPELDIRDRNANTVQQLEDAIEFYNADVYVIDQQMESYELLKNILENSGCNYHEITDEVRDILPILINLYGEEPEVKEEIEPIHYEHKEEPKVIKQTKIIEKEVFRDRFKAIPSKIIVVGSLYSGAGSTLVSTNLARMFSEREVKVAYVEHPMIKPYMFDYLQILQYQDSHEYHDISREIYADFMVHTLNSDWVKDKVHWYVIDSREPQLPSFSHDQLLLLAHSIQSSVTIIDISDRWLDPEIQRFLHLADQIYLCVEPDPIKYDRALFRHSSNPSRESRILDYLNKNPNIKQHEVITTKYTKRIELKYWNEMQQKEPLVKLPNIPYEIVMESLYKSKLVYDIPEYREIFEEKLLPIISMTLPKDLIKVKRGSGFVSKFINKTKKS
ncbi:hypothetical protein [Terribacillus saccharophilus]|uniref:hypothetical protein n=1 Tax=Terribacillus saccharophilus TaxID=361277 RepID=UPI002989C646|nr:hypothetical protein [Terribacillus saccharophilus]MCM3227578.1 hypothetical protein [Terribacillus saccharophilus]